MNEYDETESYLRCYCPDCSKKHFGKVDYDGRIISFPTNEKYVEKQKVKEVIEEVGIIKNQQNFILHRLGLED